MAINTSKTKFGYRLWHLLPLVVLIPLVPLTLVSSYLLCASFSRLPSEADEWKQLTLSHLRGLQRSVREEQAAARMQAIFPEGACFTVTLYGLGWARAAAFGHLTDEERLEAIDEITWALRELNEGYVLAPFSDTQVRNGVFWLGQRNLLLGHYLRLLDPSERPSDLISEFHRDSRQLATAFSKSPTTHLDSYRGLCWPADNVTALASLFLHDELYGTDHRDVFEDWEEWTSTNSDPSTSLPAGHLHSDTGVLRQPARGCATSWIIALISEIDRDHANVLYQRYKETMNIERLGFTMFREYPATSQLRADIDSGPVIWDAGVVATGVGLATSLAMEDGHTANDIHALTRMLGLKWESSRNGQRATRHLFGKLPVGDAFLAWSYTFGLRNPLPTDRGAIFKSSDLLAITTCLVASSVWMVSRMRISSQSRVSLGNKNTPR